MGLADFSGGVSQASSALTSSAYSAAGQIQDYQSSVASKYILQPKGLAGIAGFVFDYQGDEDLMLVSEITDHYSENNIAVQDHIANKTYQFTLRGFVSELSLPALGGGVRGALSTLQTKLAASSAYTGKYTPQAALKLQAAAQKSLATVNNYVGQATQYLNQARSLAAFFGGAAATLTKQQKAFVQLSSLRDSRQVFNVVTPWTMIPNVAIQRLVFMQPRETPTLSDITVVMKQLVFVNEDAQANALIAGQGRAAYQQQGSMPAHLGSTPGASASFSTTPWSQSGIEAVA